MSIHHISVQIVMYNLRAGMSRPGEIMLKVEAKDLTEAVDITHRALQRIVDEETARTQLKQLQCPHGACTVVGVEVKCDACGLFIAKKRESDAG